MVIKEITVEEMLSIILKEEQDQVVQFMKILEIKNLIKILNRIVTTQRRCMMIIQMIMRMNKVITMDNLSDRPKRPL